MIADTPATAPLDRRSQLLGVALTLFAEKGYHATSIADIIESASVARGTFYNYFKNKRQIFGQLLDHLFEDVMSVAFTIDTESAEGVGQQVRRLIRGICSKMRENHSMARVLLEQAVGLDAEANAQLQAFYERIFGRLNDAIEDGQSRGIVREGNSTALATCMLGMVKESLYQHVLGTCTLELDDMVEEIFGVAARGILVSRG